MADVPITTNDLRAYLADALTEEETARIEKLLREDPQLLRILESVLEQTESAGHCVGAIWRRHRLTCLSRTQLSHYLEGTLDESERTLVSFHLHTIACGYCQANLKDLQERASATARESIQNRKHRFVQSSSGRLPKSEP